MDKENDENDIISEPIFIYGISADNTAKVKVDEERITWPLIDWFRGNKDIKTILKWLWFNDFYWKYFWWGIREVKRSQYEKSIKV